MRSLTLLHVRSPQSKVVSEKLHDKGRVPVVSIIPRSKRSHALVRLLGQSVELGNGVVEGLLGEMARSVGAVQDLVAWVSWLQGLTKSKPTRRQRS